MNPVRARYGAVILRSILLLTVLVACYIPAAGLKAQTPGGLDLSFDGEAGFVNNIVSAIVPHADGKVLIGGGFTTVRGAMRSRVARLNADGAVDESFNPGLGANNTVRCVVLQSDGKIIIAGGFTTFNGTTRNRIARLNVDGSLDTSFNPGSGADNLIESLAVQSDGKVLIAGGFTTFNGTTRNRIARLNVDGSLDTSFNPGSGADNLIKSLAVQSDGKVLIGGSLTTFNGVTRRGLARLNIDGSLDATLNPNIGAPASVSFLSGRSDGKMLIAGTFNSINGTTRNHIARLNGDGSLDTAFDPGSGPGDLIYSIAAQSDGKVLISGAFTSFNGTARNHIARLNTDGSLDVSFNPGSGADTPVSPVAVQSDGKVLVGGLFTSINGTARNCLARLNANGSLDISFNPGMGANGQVYSLAVQGDRKVLIGGLFTSVSGTARNRIARLNNDGTLDASFSPGSGANDRVDSIVVQSDGKVLIGGLFTSVDGVARNGLARLNADGSLDTGFNPGLDNSVRCLAVQSDGKVLIGGLFTSVDGMASNGLARLNADGSLDTSFSTELEPANSVNSLAVQDDERVLIGGFFTSISGTVRNRIARLNADGSLDASFNPGSGADKSVFSVAVQGDDKVLIGGAFTRINGAARSWVARLNANGTLDSTFVPPSSLTSAAFSVVAQIDGKVLMGGSFTNFISPARNRIVRLNANGSLDTGFNPGTGADHTVNALAVQSDGRVLIGGSFTSFNGVARCYLARLENDPATQTLTASSVSHVQWLRGGASPEVQEVSFESAQIESGTWTTLGKGTRINGGWELTGLRLPFSGKIRARARTNGGFYNGSSGLLETVETYSLISAPTATAATATNITRTSADLSGIVNPNGAETTVIFQTRIFPQSFEAADSVLANQSPVPAGSEPVVVSATKTGLQPGTTYEFNITANSDAGSGAGSQSVSFTTLPNAPPVAPERQIHAPRKGVPTTIFDVAQHASDADGDALTVSIEEPASAYGSALTDGKVVTFTSSGWTGPVSVQLQVSDGFTTTSVQVVMNNTVPTVLSEISSVRTDRSVTIDVLGNDSDVDGDTLTITSFTQGTEGGAVSAQSGGLSYTPARGFTGIDYFSYTISDGFGGSATATVTVNVTPDVPVRSQVATTGLPVPGAGEDPRIPQGSLWRSFGVPSINDSGTVAFLGNVRNGSANFSGIFAGNVSFPVLVARKGETAPGTDGALFASFRDPLLSNAGEIVIVATVTGSGVRAKNSQGLWVATPATGEGYTLELLARTGDEPPGVAGARWKSFVSVLLHGEGGEPSSRSVVALATMLSGPNGAKGPGGVTTANDLGLWRFDTEGAHLLLREGLPLEVRGVSSKVKILTALSSVPGSPGHGRVSAAQCALVRVKLADGRSAIVQADGESLSVLAATGDEVAPGVQLAGLGVPGGNLAGWSEATATLKGEAVTSADRSAIALFSKAAPIELFCRTGPNFQPAELPLIKAFNDPVANSQGHAFLGTLTGKEVKANTNSALFWQYDSHGEEEGPGFRMVARKGAEAVGVAGAQWASFTSLALPERGGPLFTAKLRVGHKGTPGLGGVTSRNDVGLWGADSIGALHLIAREGEPLDGNIVRNFTILNSVPGSPAQRRSYNSKGELIYRASLRDGSQVLIHVQLP